MFDIEHYSTNYEQFNTIEIVSSYHYIPKVIYSLPIDDLKKGDILSITTEFEVTQDLNYTVMIASYVSIENSNITIDGQKICEANGFNINHALHHGVVTHSRQYQVPHDYPGRWYLNSIAYSASTDAGSSDVLKIERGYGHLDAIVFRKSGQ